MLLLIVQGSAAAADELRVVTHMLPPLTTGDPESPAGVSVELVKTIMQRTGDTGSPQVEPFPRLLQDVRTGPRTVGFIVARTPEREPLMQWVGPILVSGVYLYKKAGSPVQIATLDDARHLGGIGVTRGDADHTYLLKQGFTNLDISESQTADLRKVQLGRLAATPISELVFTRTVVAAGLDPGDFERTPVKLYDSRVFVVFSPDVPLRLVQSWAAELTAMKKSGEFATLLQRFEIGPDTIQASLNGS
jgi:polar amino acid transport system substrate-binding protein